MKIEYIFPAAKPTPPPRWYNNLAAIWRDIRSLAYAFFAVILACAIIYWIGITHEWGITRTFTETTNTGNSAAPNPGFWDCLHFSVVTIATLGYGDFRPVSYGRLVAGLEALAGIVLMGLFISKLVSRRQDRFTKRLLRGQFNSEIQKFRSDVSMLIKKFTASASVNLNEPSTILHNASGLLKSIGRYWRYESSEPDLVEVMQLRASVRLLQDVVTLLELVEKHVGSFRRSEIHRSDRVSVRNITESALTVFDTIYDRCESTGIKHLYEKCIQIILKLRDQLELAKQPW